MAKFHDINFPSQCNQWTYLSSKCIKSNKFLSDSGIPGPLSVPLYFEPQESHRQDMARYTRGLMNTNSIQTNDDAKSIILGNMVANSSDHCMPKNPYLDQREGSSMPRIGERSRPQKVVIGIRVLAAHGGDTSGFCSGEKSNKHGRFGDKLVLQRNAEWKKSNNHNQVWSAGKQGVEKIETNTPNGSNERSLSVSNGLSFLWSVNSFEWF